MQPVAPPVQSPDTGVAGSPAHGTGHDSPHASASASATTSAFASAASSGASPGGSPAGTQPGAPGNSPSGAGSGSAKAGGRETFSAEELAIVLSYFDIGIIESIIEYPRGSRKAPKLLITSEQGKFLLKRRARGKDDPNKVAFSHALQIYLAAKQFPLPHLIGTRRDNNSMLHWQNATYELFEYIPGQPYPQTLESTFDSGRILALYHKLLLDFRTEFQPSTGSYHMAPAVEHGLRLIPSMLPAGSPNAADIATLLNFLLDSYRYSAEMVEHEGIENWPRQIVHADWHPGNMLFRDNHVVAVIDYDAARLLPRIVDVANGSLQMSIIGGDDDVNKWPDYVDESRFKRFFRGYDDVQLLSQAEIRCVPWLMVEALIAEAVFPIAATGNFAKIEGLSFLQMVQRKVYWMTHNASRLIRLAEGETP